MKIAAETPEQYIAQLPDDRKEAFRKLRQTILDNLPKEFEETMSYGMIGYVVPHSIYPNGYKADPSLPLPFMNIASQKNYIALYHFGLYVDKDIIQWFQKEYAEQVPTKLDMGKSCVRMKKPEHIPYKLIGELIRKISVDDFIAMYEKTLKK